MTIEKLRMETTNIADENFKKLQELFPEAVTEIEENGEIIRAINKDAFQELINTKVVGSDKEHYELIWPGKLKAKHIAIEPTTKTLRPVIATKDREGNEDTWYKDCFNKTENIYIEGDNLDVLKIMQEQYRGKIKMIYIDPPYNTGSDFIYKDNFAQNDNEYKQNSGQTDEEGKRFVKNLESNGRLHSDWLSMMYPRLKIARNLLSDDGVIFLSIDEHESHNLRKICDEIFDEHNFFGDLIWEGTTQPTNTGSAKFGLQQKTEIILLYGKNRSAIGAFNLEEMENTLTYPHNGKYGKCRFEVIEKSDAGGYNRPTMKFQILGRYPREGKRWQIGEETARKLEKDGKVEIVDGIVKKAVYPEDEKDKIQYKPFWSLIKNEVLLKSEIVGTALNGKDEVNTIMNVALGFDTIKPVALIKKLIFHAALKSSLIMDFFAGTSTTAHAVMQLNAEDGGNRKFIMVQLPELCDEKKEAYKAGYNTICDIGKERIRRAGAKIKEELEKTNPERAKTLDTGFRVLRLDSSNMKEKVAQKVGEIRQENISDFISNIKEDRTDLDLLFQALPLLGADYTAKITEDIIDGKKVYIVEDGYIVACFDSDVNNTVIEKIASMKPVHAVFRDKCFENDSVYTNLEQIFKKHNGNFDSNPDARQIVIL